jgi:hypothetical protein
MSYTATVEVKISIPDGPPEVKEKRTINSIVSANAKRISFKFPQDGAGQDFPTEYSSDGKQHRGVCRKVRFVLENGTAAADSKQAPQQQQQQQTGPIAVSPEPKESLAFVAIKASKYQFKRCAGEDAPGIGFKLYKKDGCESPSSPCDKIEWISGDRILINICGALDQVDAIQIFVDEKLFDCSKKDGDEIVVTLTYGVSGSKVESDGTEGCGCDAIPAHVGVITKNSRYSSLNA